MNFGIRRTVISYRDWNRELLMAVMLSVLTGNETFILLYFLTESRREHGVSWSSDPESNVVWAYTS